jgi:pyruvate,water dikinase
VQGKVDPDEFYVHKPTLRQGYRAVLSRTLGGKQMRLVYAGGRGGASTRNVPTAKTAREHFCLTDAEVLELADYAIRIEDHYSKLAGQPTPMDIEWAKDGDDGKLYIVQARPETVASQRAPGTFETYSLKGTGAVLATGRAVGERIASGKVRIVADAHDLTVFQPGEVLVAEATSPDWAPVMKTAAAIVTSHGGRTCHAAIVARELGVPAVVGAAGGRETRDRTGGNGQLRRRRSRHIRRQTAIRGNPSCIGDTAPPAHRDHGQSRQSRARLPYRSAAQ